MLEAVERTIKFEFLEEHKGKQVFYSEWLFLYSFFQNLIANYMPGQLII
jgi:hypothetical protein